MTPTEKRTIEEQMRSLDDHTLLRLVAVESFDYRPEALDIARVELRQRKLEILNKEEFWARFPSEEIGLDGFCASCRSQTTDESPGNTGTVNFIFGTRLIGHDDQWPTCGSWLQTLWLQVLLPVVPLGRYRIIYLDRHLYSGRYVGRKLRGK
jgi:hypothetical protein